MSDASAVRRHAGRGLGTTIGLFGLILGLGGCAGSPGSFFASEGAGEIGAVQAESSGAEGVLVEPMTQVTMERLFAAEVDAIIGPSGAIQTRIDGVNVYLISDPIHDRMRIIAPIALTKQLDPRFLGILLEANFHRTGDARYSTSEGIVYAAFMHPISSLSPALLKSSLAQVLSLHKTFGTDFSSGVLGSSPVESAGEAGADESGESR